MVNIDRHTALAERLQETTGRDARRAKYIPGFFQRVVRCQREKRAELTDAALAGIG